MTFEIMDTNPDGMYCRCKSHGDFKAWLEGTGWRDVQDFERSTGVTFEELRGQWFSVTHNRVFIVAFDDAK